MAEVRVRLPLGALWTVVRLTYAVIHDSFAFYGRPMVALSH